MFPPVGACRDFLVSLILILHELIFILVRRVLITLELVHTALLRTRTVRDLRACACVSVRVACLHLCQLRLCLGPLRLCLRLGPCACACACPSTCVPVTLCHSLKSRPSRAQSSLSSSLTGIDFLGFFAGGTRAWPPTGVGERGVGPMPRGGTGVAARAEAVASGATGWLKLAKCHGFFW